MADDDNSPIRGISRRQLLGGGAALSLGGLLGAVAPAAAAPAATGSYTISGWDGDEYELAHKLRDGWRPPEPKIWKKHEVVVVGAGLSGLAAAFKLRHMDVQVLELARTLGGNARSTRYKNWEFNIGSAYFVGLEGEPGKLYAELGLKPKPVDHPLDRWWYRGRWISDPWREESIGQLPNDMQRAMRAIKRAFKACEGKDFPQNPYATSTARALQLDKLSFAEWLKPHAHPDVMAFLDAYGYGALGAPASVFSAYGGINFYADVIEERAYAYNEGNAFIAQAAAAQIRQAGADRIREGCAVYRIVPVGNDLARVYYHHRGETFGVEAKRVVLAVPYFAAARMIDGLAPGQRYALGCQRYAAYVVANLCFDKVIVGAATAYDNWAPAVTQFEDYLPVGWANKEQERPRTADGQVIGLFAGQHRPVLSRWRMIAQRPEHFARPMVDAFEKLFPGSKQHLRHVHMTRWGHAFIINRPGMYTRWLPSIKKQIGPIVLAHADGQGLPAIEASAGEAADAARWVLKRWSRPK